MVSVSRSPSIAHGFEWLALCASLAAGERCAFAASFLSPLWPLAAFAAFAALVACIACASRPSRLAVAFAAGVALALHSAQSRRDVFDEANVLGRGRPFAREFRVEGGVSSAAEEGRTPDLRLDHLTALRRLFGLEAFALGSAYKNWFPLPFFVSPADTF